MSSLSVNTNVNAISNSGRRYMAGPTAWIVFYDAT